MKLSVKFTTSLTIFGVILTIVISWISYTITKNNLQDKQFEIIKNAAMTCASLIDGDEVKTLLQKDGNKSEYYKEVKRVLDSLKKNNNLAYLVLHSPTSDKSTVIYEANIEGDDQSEILQYRDETIYEVVSEGDSKILEDYKKMYNDFINKKESTVPMITDNEYGYLYASYANVYDKSGTPVAMIDASISMEGVRDSLRQLLLLIAVLSILAIFTLIIIYLIYIRKILVSPIKILSVATSEFVAHNEIEQKNIVIKTGDEIEELANSFNKMTIDLKTYIDNLSSVTAEKERIGAELDVATKIQASMLPCIFPAFPEREEFDVYATMLPAKEVGGDFYDFFLIDDTHLAVVMADVSGKGVPAALFMVIAKTLIKNNAQYGKSPKEVFEVVNNQLCENNEAGMFVTAFMGILEISTGKFKYVNAGHNPPLIKKMNGDFNWLETKPGFVLAGMEDMFYKQEETTMQKGDVLYLYTDGVTEAVNKNEDLFSDPKLLADINKYKDCSLKELLISVKREIDKFADGAEQADDITMLALKINGGDSQ